MQKTLSFSTPDYLRKSDFPVIYFAEEIKNKFWQRARKIDWDPSQTSRLSVLVKKAFPPTVFGVSHLTQTVNNKERSGLKRLTKYSFPRDHCLLSSFFCHVIISFNSLTAQSLPESSWQLCPELWMEKHSKPSHIKEKRNHKPCVVWEIFCFCWGFFSLYTGHLQPKAML